MASSLLAAMGITKPANSSFQPESFANADKEIQQPVVNVGPPAQEGKQIQTQTRPQPQPHQDPDEVPSEQEFDFNTILQEQEDMTTETVLHQRYVFYCLKRGKGASNYEEGVRRLGSFQTVEHFWRIYDHIVRPNDHKTTIDYHLFKNGIKPTWEDPNNENGGKWMVRLKKGLASVYWEELVLAIIGEQFDVGSEICGAVVSVRGGEDILSVWNKTAENKEATDRIRDKMREVLKLPIVIPMEYKKHHDSLNDKSSFRNTQVWRVPKGEGGRGGRRDHRDRDNGRRGTGGDRDGGGSNKAAWAESRKPRSGSIGAGAGAGGGVPDGVGGGSSGNGGTAESSAALLAGSSWGKYHREGASGATAWSRGRGVGTDDKKTAVSKSDGISRPAAPTNAWGL